MQEEVTQRTVALCVEATRLSAGMPTSLRRHSGSSPQRTWREKKPSIRKELEQAKQQAKAQHRQREKVKTKDRGVEL